MSATFVEAVKGVLPKPLRLWLSQTRRSLRRKMLPFDRVTDFSALRRVEPYRPAFGWHRGQCIDRYYIEAFISANSRDITGHVMEVGSDEYSRRFGGGAVSRVEILDMDPRNPARTITADLTTGDSIPGDAFDCIICTQTIQFIYEFTAVIRTCHRILRPGGVVLATVPGISQLCPTPLIGGAGVDYWRFTEQSARRLFGEVFGEGNVEVVTFGNVLTSVAFLHGLVVAELSPDELNYRDANYLLIAGIRACKAHD